MPLGLGESLAVLPRSPHDASCPPIVGSEAVVERQHWVPSRYNIRATAEDGRLILWNTLSGTMSVFEADDKGKILGLLKKKGFEAKRSGLIGYLVDRGLLIRQGVNEYRKFQRAFGEQHYRADVLELIIMPSEDCNFRCEYCYEDFDKGTMIPEVRSGLKEMARKRIKSLNRLKVGWFGGEPLYGWEAVADLAPFYSELAREHDIPYFSHMTTNGYLLTPEIAEQLLEWRVTHFQITLDGPAEYHDKSRPGRNGEPTFDRIFGNLKSLAQRDDQFTVTLRVNISGSNAEGVPKLVEMLGEEFGGDSRFTMDPHTVGKWGGSNDENLSVCGDDDAQNIIDDMKSVARKKGLDFGTLRDATPLGSQVCYAARPYNFLIGATGKIMKCTIVLDKDERNVVGRVTPDGRFELNDDLMGLWTEPAFEQDTQCQKCLVLPMCQGISCPLIRMDHDTQPCISTRARPKQQMLESLKYPRTLKTRSTSPAKEASPAS